MALDKLVDRLVKRIEEVNIYALKDIAKTIKKLRTLSPSDTHKLIQIMEMLKQQHIIQH